MISHMKKSICAALTLAFMPSVYAADTYILDPMHSYVEWHINHFGFSNPSGKWMANGTIVLDEQKPENSKVDVKINVADIVTGIPDLDKSIRSKLFLNAEKFPTATFVSDKIGVKDNNISTVSGILTVHGVSKPVVLNVKLNKKGQNPITEKESVGYTASTELKRSDFEINTLLPGLGDDVKIDIEVEAAKN